MTDIRYCEDCKFYKSGGASGAEFAKCFSPQNVRPEGPLALVSRQPGENPIYIYCVALRSEPSSAREKNMCGPDAKWFEPKVGEKAA